MVPSMLITSGHVLRDSSGSFAMFSRDALCLVVKLSVHFLIPVPILPPGTAGIEQIRPRGGSHNGQTRRLL